MLQFMASVNAQEQALVNSQTHTRVARPAEVLACPPERVFKRTYLKQMQLAITIPGTSLQDARPRRFRESLRGGFTVYTIRVHDARHKISWQVSKRFSDFIPLLKNIEAVHSVLSVPPLPPTRVFSKASAASVEERRGKLEHFLQRAAFVLALQKDANMLQPRRQLVREIHLNLLAQRVRTIFLQWLEAPLEVCAELTSAEKSDDLARSRKAILEEASRRFPNVYDVGTVTSAKLLQFLGEHAEPDYLAVRKIASRRSAQSEAKRGRIVRTFNHFVESVRWQLQHSREWCTGIGDSLHQLSTFYSLCSAPVEQQEVQLVAFYGVSHVQQPTAVDHLTQFRWHHGHNRLPIFHIPTSGGGGGGGGRREQRPRTVHGRSGIAEEQSPDMPNRQYLGCLAANWSPDYLTPATSTSAHDRSTSRPRSTGPRLDGLMVIPLAEGCTVRLIEAERKAVPDRSQGPRALLGLFDKAGEGEEGGEDEGRGEKRSIVIGQLCESRQNQRVAGSSAQNVESVQQAAAAPAAAPAAAGVATAVHDDAGGDASAAARASERPDTEADTEGGAVALWSPDTVEWAARVRDKAGEGGRCVAHLPRWHARGIQMAHTFCILASCIIYIYGMHPCPACLSNTPHFVHVHSTVCHLCGCVSIPYLYQCTYA